MNNERYLKWRKILTCLFYTRLCGEGQGIVRDGTLGAPGKHKKDQNSEYIATYSEICSRVKKNFIAFVEWTSKNSTVCHNWWERKYENKTPTTGGRLHLKNDLQFFWGRCYKNLQETRKGFSILLELPFFLTLWSRNYFFNFSTPCI